MKHRNVVLLLLLSLSIANPAKAATPGGEVTISLDPQSITLAPNSPQTVDIVLNTNALSTGLDSVQAFLDVSNYIPSDLAITPRTVLGLSPSVVVQDNGSSKRIIYSATKGDPLNPAYKTNGSSVILATISYMSGANGTSSDFSWATLFTSAFENGTSADVLDMPSDATYTFQTATPVTTVAISSASSDATGTVATITGTATAYADVDVSITNLVDGEVATWSGTANGDDIWNTTITGLEPGKTYTANVTATVAGGTSASDSTEFTTTEPAATDLTATLMFRLESITDGSAAAHNMTYSLKSYDSNTRTFADIAGVDPISTTNITPDNSGVYTSPLLNFAANTGEYGLCVKGETHLRKCFLQNISENTGTINMSTNSLEMLVAGDVASDGGGVAIRGGDNIIDGFDLAYVSSKYTDFSVPVSGDSELAAADINHDGYIDIQDLALISMNYTSFSVQGD